MFGWAGTILRVDLSTGKISKQPLSSELAKGFLGGRGFNVKTLYDEVGPKIQPLSPENRLIFSIGPLAGTLAPCSARWNVTARSPLTGILGDSNAGGHWGPELRWAGYDMIVTQGRAKEPVYLWINDDNVELKSAKHIWKRDVTETNEIIKEGIGDRETKIACIGPAGENLVKFACVLSDLTRAAGRCGTGAVMGSKNLKAIAVRGTKDAEIARPEAFEKACLKAHESIVKHPSFKDWFIQGTSLILAGVNAQGRLRVRNFQENIFEKAWEISGEVLVQNYVIKNKGCFSCPISCSHYYHVREGPYAGTYGEGPEYEAQDGFGANLGIGEWPPILHMNTLVNELGLDVCSTAQTLSFATECYQRGLIDEKDTGGIRLEWGNAEAAIEMIKKIAHREGFGDILAEGALAAARKIGKGAEKYTMTIKGLETTAVELRGAQGWGLAFATSTRGADHLRAPVLISTWGFAPQLGKKHFGTEKAVDRFSPDAKPLSVKWHEELAAVIDSLSLCKFPMMLWMGYAIPDLVAELFSTATGWNVSGDDLMKIGERIYHVEKAFNTRLGLTRKDDKVPNRMLKEVCPHPPANTPKALVKLDIMLPEYYKLRGWDPKTGLVPRDKYEELGLKYIADELEKMEKLPKKVSGQEE
ncbi:MAG: aldehyde ferredoxin oxidoreductase family protein [Candidatus Heimdallarchaeota archaeon]